MWSVDGRSRFRSVNVLVSFPFGWGGWWSSVLRVTFLWTAVSYFVSSDWILYVDVLQMFIFLRFEVSFDDILLLSFLHLLS